MEGSKQTNAPGVLSPSWLCVDSPPPPFTQAVAKAAPGGRRDPVLIHHGSSSFWINRHHACGASERDLSRSSFCSLSCLLPLLFYEKHAGTHLYTHLAENPLFFALRHRRSACQEACLRASKTAHRRPDKNPTSQRNWRSSWRTG